MNKKLITEIVIKELPDDHPDKLLTADNVFVRYWVTGRASETMRLTNHGYDVFKSAGLQEYSYRSFVRELTNKLNNIKVNEFTLLLSKQLKCPWYLTIDEPVKDSFTLKIFDSRIAMMINLYGSVEEYLKAKI